MIDFNEATVIRRLRGIVRRNNWNIQKLADETGLSVHQVRHIRHDYFSPPAEVLRILEIFVRRYEEQVEGIEPKHLTNPGQKIICSLKTPDFELCETLAKELYQTIGGIKLGTDFFINNTIDDAKRIMSQVPEMSLILDFNLYGTPHQIQSTIKTLMPVKADFITLNTGGGQRMMRFARRIAERFADDNNIQRPRLLGTTMLPSIDEQDAKEMGISESLSDHVLHLARLAEESGMNGVVCAGEDIARLRKELNPEMLLFANAIRPKNFSPPKDEDQKRVFSASQAIKDGANYLLVGRPITDAKYAVVAANQIINRLVVSLDDDKTADVM